MVDQSLLKGLMDDVPSQIIVWARVKNYLPLPVVDVAVWGMFGGCEVGALAKLWRNRNVVVA